MRKFFIAIALVLSLGFTSVAQAAPFASVFDEDGSEIKVSKFMSYDLNTMVLKVKTDDGKDLTFGSDADIMVTFYIEGPTVMAEKGKLGYLIPKDGGIVYQSVQGSTLIWQGE